MSARTTSGARATSLARSTSLTTTSATASRQELGRKLNGKPVAVACSAGIRSAVAASLLRRAGLEGVQHVVDGGIEDLPDEGVELVEAPAGVDT